MSAAEKVREYLDSDIEKLWKLIEKNPIHIKIKDAAEFLQLSESSMRAAVDRGELGLSWRKDGKLQTTRVIFTAKFVRWYTNGMSGI